MEHQRLPPLGMAWGVLPTPSTAVPLQPFKPTGMHYSRTLFVPSRSGDVATGNFTILNAGTLNLTSVTYGVVNETDPRVAAIIVACSNFVLNGTLPAGASLLQCTEKLNFTNVTFIEPGDVVFNLTAAANGVSQQSRQVTVRVDNTPSLSMKVNSSQCTAPRRAGAFQQAAPAGFCRANFFFQGQQCSCAEVCCKQHRDCLAWLCSTITADGQLLLLLLLLQVAASSALMPSAWSTQAACALSLMTSLLTAPLAARL